MAIFGTKKNKEEKAVPAAKLVKAVKAAKPAKAVAVRSAAPAAAIADASVILRPRVTEKSGLLSQSGVYTFEVTKSADKQSVAKAVKSLYKVSPARVAIINLHAKKVFVKGRHGTVAGIRKAMVTLKKGDKIDFV